MIAGARLTGYGEITSRPPRLHCIRRPNYRRQRLIGGVEQLGRVLGLIDGLGHDHRDGLADKADLIVRHRVVAGRDRIEAPNPHRHVGSAHEPCTVRGIGSSPSVT